jgi:hypothetical protein
MITNKLKALSVLMWSDDATGARFGKEGIRSLRQVTHGPLAVNGMNPEAE